MTASCPHCDGDLVGGIPLDSTTSQRGYGCTECPHVFALIDLRSLGVQG